MRIQGIYSQDIKALALQVIAYTIAFPEKCGTGIIEKDHYTPLLGSALSCYSVTTLPFLISSSLLC